MAITKNCPVARPFQAFVLQGGPVPKISGINGGMQQVQIQTVNISVHELVAFNTNTFEFYCKYCCQIALQKDWIAALEGTGAGN